MSTRPWFHPLDRNDERQIADMKTARAIDLPHEQHALMTGHGGPPQGRACYITATRTVSVRVPPGVTDMDIEMWASCDGTNDESYVVFTSGVDAVGTKFNLVGGEESDVSMAQRYKTGGAIDSGIGAHSGRALTVRAAAAWEFSNVDVTVTVNTSAADVVIFYLGFHPIHAIR